MRTNEPDSKNADADAQADRAAAIAARIENEDALEGTFTDDMFTRDELAEHPHRDPDRLRAAYDRHGTVTGVAEDLGAHKSTISRWLHAFGVREPAAGYRIDAASIRAAVERGEIGPDAIGGETA